MDNIDSNIKRSNDVVNTTIQNASANFENTIKAQADSMSRAVVTAGDSFKGAIQDTAKDFEKMAHSISESIFDQEQILKNVSQELKVAVDKTLRDLTDQSKLTMKEYETSLHNIIMSQFNTIKDSVSTASKDFNSLLTANLTKSTSVLEQQTQLLDKALQDELRKSIELMGSHLASLSGKFVQDYSSLAEELRKVVRITDQLKLGGKL
jgi:hypothetical protein